MFLCILERLRASAGSNAASNVSRTLIYSFTVFISDLFLFQKETNPFVTTPSGNSNFLPQKISKSTAVSIKYKTNSGYYS